MIFVTTGTQFPFNRLVNTVDAWSSSLENVQVFAQTGPEGEAPKHIESQALLAPDEYESVISKTTHLIAHAGIGSIITAIEHNIPAILMPRKYTLGEHRNDHQMATAEKFKGRRGIYIAMDEAELTSLLNKLDSLEKPNPEGSSASPELLSFVKDFIEKA
ncbi:glycosyltransferase [Corallincola platygyrae]|uniref:Glycosyltransferase n=1 Tax=Corallincola platygyrae TaxID=1193278 RepID=A0ABW4XJM7_9GAMM